MIYCQQLFALLPATLCFAIGKSMVCSMTIDNSANLFVGDTPTPYAGKPCKIFFRNPPSPLISSTDVATRDSLSKLNSPLAAPSVSLKGLHLSLYPLSSGEGKNGKSRSRFSAMFWYRGTTRCSYLLSRSAIYQRRIKAQP